MPFARASAAAGIPCVVATTGLSAAQRAEIEELGARAAVLLAPNLSLGINLIVELLPTIVKALGPDYDVEIVEAHHRHKVDAPSGTAIRLAEAIAAALERPLADLERHGRHGVAPRVTGEIGMHALRLGGLAGEHSVYFANEGEVVEIVSPSRSVVRLCSRCDPGGPISGWQAARSCIRCRTFSGCVTRSQRRTPFYPGHHTPILDRPHLHTSRSSTNLVESFTYRGGRLAATRWPWRTRRARYDTPTVRLQRVVHPSIVFRRSRMRTPRFRT